MSEVRWATHAEALMRVRRVIFIKEQGVSEEEELDGEDAACQDFLATDEQDELIGTARLMPSGQIGRIAVLPAWRRRNVGAGLLAAAVEAARSSSKRRMASRRSRAGAGSSASSTLKLRYDLIRMDSMFMVRFL